MDNKRIQKSPKKILPVKTNKEEPEILGFMKIHVKEHQKPMTSPNELPTPEDVRKLVNTRNKLRNKTLIFFTWDTGARIGSILNLKWKDINFSEKGAKIKFRNNKSMNRQIPIYESVEHLKKWKERTLSPKKNDYVFVNIGKRGGNSDTYGEQMKYPSAAKVFRKAGKEIEADYKTNPHAYRKARATYLASKGMNAVQLCNYFGWNNFKTAKTYIRMAEKDLDKAIKNIEGFEETEPEEQEDLRPIKCENCDTINPATRNYCKDCGQLISKEKELLKEQKKEKIKDQILKEELDLSEEELNDLIKNKMKQKNKIKGRS